MKTKIVTQPIGHVLSIETCRAHLEIVPIDSDSDGESHPDDGLILAMLDAAVEHAEDFTGQSISIKTYEAAMDEFPDGDIELLHPPLIELISFTTGDESDATAVDPGAYLVSDYGDMARIRPLASWPSTSVPVADTIKIQYRAGYSSEGNSDTDAQPLPANIRAAILLMLGHLYNNREDSAEKAVSTIPGGFEALLRPRRVRMGMA